MAQKIPLQNIYNQRKWKHMSTQETCAGMSAIALLIRARKMETTPTSVSWRQHRDRGPVHAPTGTNLDDVIPSERSQTRRPHGVRLLWWERSGTCKSRETESRTVLGWGEQARLEGHKAESISLSSFFLLKKKKNPTKQKQTKVICVCLKNVMKTQWDQIFLLSRSNHC